MRDEQGEARYWQGVMTDITARREAEQSLAEAEARYRALVEQTPTITYLDSAGGPSVHDVHEPAVRGGPGLHATRSGTPTTIS